jgi:tRNA_anti-like
MPRYDDDDDRPRRRRRLDEEEDDDDRPRSRRRSYRDDEDDYEEPPRRRRRSRRAAKQLNVFGLIALVIGGVSVFVFCLGKWAFIPAGIGLLLGFIGLVVAQKSEGRQGSGLPIAGLSVSGLAVLLALGWMLLVKGVEKKLEQMDAQIEADIAKEEAKRKVELDKAAKDVQAATADNVIRVSAAQFYNAYADDEDRADRFYKNKVIEVTGVVHELNFRGEVYMVMLKGGPDEFETVHCSFAKDPAVRERLAQLRPGQTVTIRGKCLGGTSDLEACILVQPGAGD